MARTPTLTFDRGTLILHPPPRGKVWVDYATWDDRVEKFRIPALQYRSLVEALKDAGTEVNDKARGFSVQPFEKEGTREPLRHQTEALSAWIQGDETAKMCWGKVEDASLPTLLRFQGP